MYYTYMIRCKDNSIYTGITTDLERRMTEHLEKNDKCAKYTRKHEYDKLEAAWTSETRSIASKLEYHIKNLKKEQKENIIKYDESFNNCLEMKIDIEEYKRVSKEDIYKININLKS